ncbi:unnamed protein product [Amaranthus hypochondriacus]
MTAATVVEAIDERRLDREKRRWEVVGSTGGRSTGRLDGSSIDGGLSRNSYLEVRFLGLVREGEIRRREKREGGGLAGGGPAGDCLAGSFRWFDGVHLAGDFCMVAGVRGRSVREISHFRFIGLGFKEREWTNGQLGLLLGKKGLNFENDHDISSDVIIDVGDGNSGLSSVLESVAFQFTHSGPNYFHSFLSFDPFIFQVHAPMFMNLQTEFLLFMVEGQANFYSP